MRGGADGKDGQPPVLRLRNQLWDLDRADRRRQGHHGERFYIFFLFGLSGFTGSWNPPSPFLWLFTPDWVVLVVRYDPVLLRRWMRW